MKCPECLEVVMEGDSQCPYCGACLEDDSEYGIEDDEERGLASVISVSDEQEACAVKEVLEGDGIPVIIKSQKTGPDRGDCYGVDTWGEILVNKEDMDHATAAIQKYVDTQRELLIQEEVPEDEESVI